MVDKVQLPETKPANGAATGAPVPPRRPPGHRNTDVRDTVAEMAARAQEISQEAGSKVAAAMKDVINAAAGIAGFAVESARDLVQFMVRRGQMTQEEADKLLREAEEAYAKRKPLATVKQPVARVEPVRPAAPKPPAPVIAVPSPRPAPKVAAAAKSAPRASKSPKPAAKKSAAVRSKSGAKAAAGRKKR